MFFLFAKHRFEEIKQIRKLTKDEVKDVRKKIAEEWKSADETTKQKFFLLANSIKESVKDNIWEEHWKKYESAKAWMLE